MTKKEIKLLDEINTKFKTDGRIQREHRIWVSINVNKLIEICNICNRLVRKKGIRAYLSFVVL